MFIQQKKILILSIILILFTMLATLGGLFLPNLYRDSETFTKIWQSNDFITLILAVPLLIVSILLWYKKRSLRSLLVWYSMIWFLCYNYAYYVYGALFNDFYLIYLAIYTLSIGTLVFGLYRFPIEILNQLIRPNFKRRYVIFEMLFIVIGLMVIYVMQSLAFVLSNTLPPIIIASGHVTSVVFSIDISMVVLFFVIGAILLIKKNPWGYFIAFLGNLKGVLYMIVLFYASLKTNPPEAVIWATLGLLSLSAFVFLWFGLKKQTTI